jgi:hypothetical protein
VHLPLRKHKIADWWQRMAQPIIQPHRITKPIQLVAVWMAGLVLLVGSFLTAARFLFEPAWVAPFLAISAVMIVPVFLILLFVLQTRFRPQLQEDAYYSKWLADQERVFGDFTPENLSGYQSLQLALAEGLNLEEQRIHRYDQYQGVFLVHSWRPSAERGQMADVVLRLRQHGEGPLSRDEIDHVEYVLGPKFFAAPVVKNNRKDNFRLEVSAYYPMLCLARVHLVSGSTFVLERYADFNGA